MARIELTRKKGGYNIGPYKFAQEAGKRVREVPEDVARKLLSLKDRKGERFFRRVPGSYEAAVAVIAPESRGDVSAGELTGSSPARASAPAQATEAPAAPAVTLPAFKSVAHKYKVGRFTKKPAAIEFFGEYGVEVRPGLPMSTLNKHSVEVQKRVDGGVATSAALVEGLEGLKALDVSIPDGADEDDGGDGQEDEFDSANEDGDTL